MKRKVFLSLIGAAALALLCLALWRFGWESWYLHLLDSEEFEVRAAAAGKLASMKSGRAVPRLLALVEDRKPGLWTSYPPLSLIDTTTYPLSAPVPYRADPLVALENENYAGRALHALGAGAIPALLESLRRQEVRLVAARYLGALGAEARPAVPAILAVFREDSGARPAASLALNHLGRMAEEATADLIAGLGDNEPPVRANCAQALGKIGSPAVKAIPALRPLLDDSDEEVCCAAALSLIALGEDQKRPLEVLLRLLEGAGEPVRLRAAEGLTGIDR